MKKLFLLSILGVFVLATSAVAAIVTTPAGFSVSASMPSATTMSYSLTKAIPDPVDDTKWTSAGTVAGPAPLSWASTDMAWDNTYNIWTGKHFYVIDLSPADSAGHPAPGTYQSITLAYGGETGNTGLGKHATVNAVKTYYQGQKPEVALSNGQVALKNVSTINFDTTTINNGDGGWVRLYVGLYTGKTVVADAAPFTAADASGAYSGTLTVNVTLQ